ncbi:MAG: YgiT-type zinc finger protein [Aggregatilineales bacterium]
MQPNLEPFTCPECHIGHLMPALTTYVHQYGETMISIPNMPGWRCDLCHICQFDPAAIDRIEVLIGQAGLPPNRYQPVNRPMRRPDTRPEPKPSASPAKARSKDK